MEKTGKILKESREKKGYTIQEVSIATKISSRILIAIEEGIDEDLPPRTFLRGMIQTYAKFLKIDANHVLQLFKEEYDSGNYEDSLGAPTQDIEVEEVPAEAPAKGKEESLPFTELISNRTLVHRALIVSGIIILIFIMIGIKSVVDKYEQERQVTKTPETLKSIEPGTTSEAEEQQTTLTQTDEAESTSEKSDGEDKKQNPPEEQQQAKEEPQKESPETKATAPEVSPKEEKKTEEKPPVQKTKKEEKTEEKKEPKETPKAEENKPQEIIVEALDAVKIDFRIDDGELKSIQLKPDQVHTIKAKSRVAIDISDGGVVNIIHNGKDRGVPGDLGKPVKVRYP